MSDLLIRRLRKTLRLRSGSSSILQNRESARLEFKQTFGLISLAKYTRTMIAFANNQGGYIVFGVEPSPHRLRAVNPRFHSLDPRDVAGFLRDHASPEIEWEMDTLEFHSLTIGYIYTYESNQKPVMAVRDSGSDISNGDIYYRYRGQSGKIRYGELRHIVDTRITRERELWMQHLARIAQAGPAHVGVLDTIEGKLHGPSSTFVIGEPLLRKLKFVREGSFEETTGEPTLRVIGDVQPVGGIVGERTVGIGIHGDDLLTAFLAQRQLTGSEARSFLLETAHQTSPFYPVFWYASCAGMSATEAATAIDNEESSFRSPQRRVIARLRGAEHVLPVGVTSALAPSPIPSTSTDALAQIQAARYSKDQRTLILWLTKNHPDWAIEVMNDLPTTRLSEAVTHLDRGGLVDHKDKILRLLLDVFRTKFPTLDSAGKSIFRKAVASIDEKLYASALPST